MFRASASHGMALLGCTLLFSASLFAGAPAGGKDLSVPEALRVLASGRGQEREKAAHRLANPTSAEESQYPIVQTLLEQLPKDKDPFFRIAIIEALGQIQLNVTPQTGATKIKYREPFIALLKNKEEHNLIKKAVLKVFANTLQIKEVRDQNAYLAAIEIAKSNTTEVSTRVSAIGVIGNFGADDGLDVLSTQLNDANEQIKEAAAKAIGAYLSVVTSSPTISFPTVQKLVAILENPVYKPDLKFTVVRTLARLIREGNNQAKQTALPILLAIPKTSLNLKGDPSDEAVLVGVEALGLIGIPESTPVLVDTYTLFNTPNEPKDVAKRVAVMEAFASILQYQAEQKQPNLQTVKNIATTIVTALDNDTEEVKKAAIFAARYLWPAEFKGAQVEVVNSLIGLLKDRKEGADNILQALEVITNKDFGYDQRKWKEWFEAWRRTQPK